MATRRIETRELIATVRRVAREQALYRSGTILHLNLAAAELERLAYPKEEEGDIPPNPERHYCSLPASQTNPGGESK